MPIIRRSQLSEVDVLEIWLYLAEQSASRDVADRAIDGFEATIAMLADQPGMGTARDELLKGMRSFPSGSYLIFYMPLSNGIEVLRIIHGSRNLWREFRRRRPRRT